jgi:antitoxin MazE
MLTSIRRFGNSHGVLIPKPLLKQVGLSDRAEMFVKGTTLVLRPFKAVPRRGWAEASKTVAAQTDHTLVLPDFANEGDSELGW